MSALDDLENLAKSVASGVSAPLKDIANTSAALPGELTSAAGSVSGGAGKFAGSLAAIVTRELAQIKKGLDTKRYEAVVAAIASRAGKDVESAALVIGKELKPYVDATESVIGKLDSFELGTRRAGSGGASYAGMLKPLLKSVHQAYQGACQGMGMTPLKPLDSALNAATLMLDAMPAPVSAVLEKQVPAEAVQWLLDHLNAASRSPTAAASGSSGGSATIDHLQMASKIAYYLEQGSMKLGSALTKETSVTVNAKVSGAVGLVVGWAAAVGAKLGIDAKVSQGFKLQTVPIDLAAPYFMAISVFFGLLFVGLKAAAEWLTVDQKAM